MTNREAIEELKMLKRTVKEESDSDKAIDMSISALEKQGWHNARKDPPKRPDRMWDIYCVYTRFDRYGIAKYYAHGKWDGYDEDGDQIEEYEIIAYCNFPKPYTRKTMTNDYIRKEDVKDALQEKVFHNLTDEFYGAMQAIDELEPADVVPVVRCDDCKYYGSRRWCELHSSVFDDNAFCSYGEKREE